MESVLSPVDSPAGRRSLAAITPADLCHPTLVRIPFTKEGWTFELKHDGFRAFVRKRGAHVDLRTRWNRPLSQAFPEIVAALAATPGECILDGELLVPDAEGRSDFETLRHRALLRRPRSIDAAAQASPAALIVFDVLHADGVDLRALPLERRRDWLQSWLVLEAGIQVSQSIPTHGEALFAEIAAHDCEGIVGKRLDAPYEAGRQPTWVKIKNADYSRKEALRFHGR